MADIIQYAKFYSNISDLEKKLRESADLGIHLKIDSQLSEKVIEAAEVIKEHIKKQEGSIHFS